MSANEIELLTAGEVERKSFLSNRLLGILGMIGAPMLLVEMVSRALMSKPELVDGGLAGALGVFYMGGWIAGAIGMRRLRVVTGNTIGSRIVFAVQLTALILTFLFSAQEFFGIDAENDRLVFFVTDIAYPLSHLFMLIVGIFVWRARVWRREGLRLAPLLVGTSLPLPFAVMSIAGIAVGGIFFSGLTATGLGTIAFTIFKGDKIE